MPRVSRLSMQRVMTRHRSGLPRRTLLICWERVSGSVILSCAIHDARTIAFVHHQATEKLQRR